MTGELPRPWVQSDNRTTMVEEIVTNGARALQHKLVLLRARIGLGVAALDGGDASEIAETELESYLARLVRQPPRRKR